jgi:hypothetical protein
VNRVHEMVNQAALRSTVDSRQWHLERLVGARLAGATEPGSSLRVGEKRRDLRGVLAEGFGGRLDGEARPATVKGEQRRSGTKGSTRCGDERRCERNIL